MKRTLLCAAACLIFSTSAIAQNNPLSAIWPFGKEKKARPVSATVNPFTSRAKPSGDSEFFKIPTPTKLIDSAQKRTDAVFAKTRDTWRGVQDFGKSLNPFTTKTMQAAKPKRSILGSLLPKKSSDGPPETMNDFMKLSRPRF